MFDGELYVQIQISDVQVPCLTAGMYPYPGRVMQYISWTVVDRQLASCYIVSLLTVASRSLYVSLVASLRSFLRSFKCSVLFEYYVALNSDAGFVNH